MAEFLSTRTSKMMSDHCHILLEIKVKDWGPKSFRLVNAWNHHPGFKDFVREKWNSYVIDDWGGYILKEKLKNLTTYIKKWNIEIFVFGLEPEDIVKWNEESTRLFSDYKYLDNLHQQKAKCKWIVEGDANTKFFHRIDGIWREEVTEFKKGIYDFFEKHFSLEAFDRPISRPYFTRKRISVEENLMLTSEFTKAEVVEVLRSCEANKSPGPDGFIMGFFRDTWEMYKEDFMRFNFNQTELYGLWSASQWHKHPCLLMAVLQNSSNLKRGLRQWDPLSPFFFLLAAEEINTI
ncbi:hypothetical protein ACS0TY_035508 [Phlomoides rotata]